jgi:hypothetical protein
MRIGRGIAAAVVLGWLMAAQVSQHTIERRLRELTTRFRELATTPRGPGRDEALARVASGAASVAAVQRSDGRALILAGSADLLRGDAAGALARYRAALARGERAEIDLNIARAHLLRRDVAAAQPALVRAAWISPALARTLPKAARRSLLRDVKLLERRLRAGRLAAPPALADVDRPAPRR